MEFLLMAPNKKGLSKVLSHITGKKLYAIRNIFLEKCTHKHYAHCKALSKNLMVLFGSPKLCIVQASKLDVEGYP